MLYENPQMLMVQSKSCLPDHSGRDLSTEENAQVADCVGGEHTDDGKGDGEVFIQGIGAFSWRRDRQKQITPESISLWEKYIIKM